MTTPLYRLILKQAWQITSRYKALWLFGFLGTFLGMGGEYQFFINQYINFSEGGWQQVAGIVDIFNYENLAIIKTSLAALPGRAFLILFFILLFLALFCWVVVSAQGALVRGAGNILKGSRASLGRDFKAAAKAFWPLLGINLGTRLLALFLLAVVGSPLFSIIFALNESYAGAGAALLFFVLGLPLGILFSLISKLATAYHLLEAKPWRSAIASAMRLFGQHWLVCLELALILLPISVLVSLVFIPLVSLLSLPFLVFGLAVSSSVSSALAVKLFFALALILFFTLLLLLGSALATFQSAVWTSLFMKIKDAPAQSKLVRILHDWRERYT